MMDRLSLARAFVSGREDLQPIPVLVHILRSFVKAEQNLDLRPIIDAVERETTVLSKVLVVANSPAYRRAKPVMAVRDAINQMCLDAAKRVIMAQALREAYDFGRCQSFSLKRYMVHAIRVAHLASIVGQSIVSLAEVLGSNDDDGSDPDVVSMSPSDWYCIGLLYNIGLLLMVEKEPSGMDALLSESEGGGLIRAERSMLGFDHCDVSAVVMADWGLPSPFHEPLPYLDCPSYRGRWRGGAAVIDLARCLASATKNNERNDSDDIVSDVIDEWSDRWAIRLPAPLPISSAMMDEATSLMEAVL